MTTAKISLYQVKHIRSCEQLAITDLGLSEDELMERAGHSAFRTLTKLYPSVRNIAVFCGSGNNAGDGYVLARLAQEKGYTVVIHQYKTVEELPPAARHASLTAIAAGVNCQPLEETIDTEVELIVDALLGIGLEGKVKGPIVTAINQINDCGLPVLALDIPSGLDADTGAVLGACVKATTTMTFIARKLGLMTLDGPDYCGKIVCDSLGLEHCLSSIQPAVQVLNESLRNTLLPPRLKNSHKGHYGHVLIIGGGHGMPGSVFLTANAALRVGAGLVTIATRPEHAGHVLPALPEAMIYGIEEVDEVLPLISRATICVIGPGLGEDEWAHALFTKALTSQLPMVIDASALRILANNRQHDDNWILTPHPGEAASLLSCSTAEIQRDRYKAINELQAQYGGNVILKGVGTLITTHESETYLCAAGNPGMASAGMGDALNGIIAGLFAQGLSLSDAAKLGVWLHATAADAAAIAKGERGLLASDLMPYIRQQVNAVSTMVSE
ncbi:bifunctional ADP-dependent NAD(P)H-hydrate dehydratase/NAD(P)H-hydrate epimerase [Legionella hackeliae]|uniref:Bifunctional NAD(P)H-hydrate repair enzyme n=1 Tax=Legionella hackeliae TaxID=449 RepID=A0A0A8USM8_LEGHA|nr:bifunctional ADP-dependent NAD(P)H-hydrate dehydratase/NAD(P)H-hydrate epimerase [Legionella hackeliae]KTD09966.1 carbohydrate kinase [Legionella hackeliae]CEK11733.1 putative carbohydrate kinase [Legionella hackeliae]STX48503.1 carbohydrate kinase [Legionella hackeliae]